MKKFVVFAFLCLMSVCLSSCDNDDDFFYVEYYVRHTGGYNDDSTVKMTIANANSQAEEYEVSQTRKVMVGPVKEGFVASLTVEAPKSGTNDASIRIARNSTTMGKEYASFSGSKQRETLVYRITETTDTFKY